MFMDNWLQVKSHYDVICQVSDSFSANNIAARTVAKCAEEVFPKTRYMINQPRIARAGLWCICILPPTLPKKSGQMIGRRAGI